MANAAKPKVSLAVINMSFSFHSRADFINEIIRVTKEYRSRHWTVRGIFHRALELNPFYPERLHYTIQAPLVDFEAPNRSLKRVYRGRNGLILQSQTEAVMVCERKKCHLRNFSVESSKIDVDESLETPSQNLRVKCKGFAQIARGNDPVLNPDDPNPIRHVFSPF
jgi:hypothetical protein